MKSFLRHLIKKILFKNRSPKKFLAARIALDRIEESVILKSGENEFNISQTHCIVCHAPFCMAAWIPSDQYQLLDTGRLEAIVKKGEMTNAEVTLSLKLKIDLTGGMVAIFEILKARCFQLNYLHQFILLKRYFLYKKKDTFLQGTIYSAMYSYPRRVILVSYRDYEYYNIFPMDFQCFVEDKNAFILGLRTSNITLKKILESKKMVISDTSAADLKVVYELGRNHSAAPPPIEKLPFQVISSDTYDFPVPGFATSYKEVEIIKSWELGTHTLMIAKVVQARQLQEGDSFIHHIHFFEFVRSDYAELSEVV